ncbi:MAG TPA: CsbD family protein [Candidatus Thermoplasmatota archaeon]|nr:CsbD family protein [Candidatus Thermoplasmatota archaeon]
MDERTGTWDKIKGKTNDAVGGARGDLGQQIRGKAQQVKGEGKDVLHDLKHRERRDVERI